MKGLDKPSNPLGCSRQKCPRCGAGGGGEQFIRPSLVLAPHSLLFLCPPPGAVFSSPHPLPPQAIPIQLYRPGNSGSEFEQTAPVAGDGALDADPGKDSSGKGRPGVGVVNADDVRPLGRGGGGTRGQESAELVARGGGGSGRWG